MDRITGRAMEAVPTENSVRIDIQRITSIEVAFRSEYHRQFSRVGKPGQPAIEAEVHGLIRRMIGDE